MLLDSPIIPKYSWKLPRLPVASLASRWYLHSLLISGGFGDFTIYSRRVLGVFFYRLRQLRIAKYSYAESIAPFLYLNYCARLVPRPCLDWERVAGRKMLPITPALFSTLAHAYYSPNYAGIIGAGLKSTCGSFAIDAVHLTDIAANCKYGLLDHQAPRTETQKLTGQWTVWSVPVVSRARQLHKRRKDAEYVFVAVTRATSLAQVLPWLHERPVLHRCCHGYTSGQSCTGVAVISLRPLTLVFVYRWMSYNVGI